MGIKQRILITGPESTGKSWLTQELASTFSGAFTEEFARAYLASLDRHYEQEDLLCIWLGQADLEDKKVAEGHPLLFCDTGPEVIAIWSHVRFGTIHPTIAKAVEERHYDYRLLLYPDLPWEYDPQREAPEEATRIWLFEQYETLLKRHGLPYEVVRGTYEDRGTLAKSLVRRHLFGHRY